jgi:hypothetical protein
MAKTKDSADRELAAINSILRALENLDGESIQRVLDYVFSRLSIASPRRVQASSTVIPQIASADTSRARPASIRDLKEEKQPESSNQMAALVAYYLSEIAGDEERKDAINAADLEKYFQQARFKLPKSLPSALPNATAAGYFDPTGSGLYKLNAVGYNLVVHGLPRARSTPVRRTRQKSKTKAKKPAR